jgi:hypothetical protein
VDLGGATVGVGPDVTSEADLRRIIAIAEDRFGPVGIVPEHVRSDATRARAAVHRALADVSRVRGRGTSTSRTSGSCPISTS